MKRVGRWQDLRLYMEKTKTFQDNTQQGFRVPSDLTDSPNSRGSLYFASCAMAASLLGKAAK